MSISLSKSERSNRKLTKLIDAYSGEEYLGLMDRFRKEGMPLSVAVVDIDWHLMDVPEEFGTAWTGYTYVAP